MEKAQVFHNGKQVWSVGPMQNNTFFGPYKGDATKMADRILNFQEDIYHSKDNDQSEKVHLETDEQIWIPVVPGALCKWDPTMEMIRGPDNQIYLRTTRDIMPREELRAWFSPSLERELGISKHDMNTKGSGHQCRTCDMINQRTTLSKHALYNRSTSTVSSLSTSDTIKGQTQMEFIRFDGGANDRGLHSAFRCFSHKKFPPIENPKLASLISSFSHPRDLKDASPESLADYHKKEFRKKFQGNEQYLRKHLYREGLNKRSLLRLSEDEHAQHYLTTVSITRPTIKYENFQTSCYDNSDVDKSRFRHEVAGDRHEKVLSNEAGKHRIWNPFCSYDISTKPDISSNENNDTISTDSERSKPIMPTPETERVNSEDKTSQSDSDDHDLSESKSKDISIDKDSSHLDEDSDKVTTEISAEETNDEENKRKELDTSSEIFGTKTGEITTGNIKHQASLMSRYYYSAVRPWIHPSASMLSPLSIKEMTSRANTLASLSRYQNLHQLTLPYGIPSSTQSRSRVTQGFTCDFCGKVYCRKYVLKIHMRTHTGFKPLKCKFCDKSFSDPSNMKKHVKLHETENTVHKCKHCGRNFVRYRGLLNHIKSKHTERLNMGMII